MQNVPPIPVHESIAQVTTREELWHQPFSSVVNVICLSRNLEGFDFQGLTTWLLNHNQYPDFFTLSTFKDAGWFLSPYKKERNLIIEDMEFVQAGNSFQAQLRVIPPGMNVFPEFHVDTASVSDDFRRDKGRFLCTYFGLVTQGLLSENAERAHLNETKRPIYLPKRNSGPFSFNVGDIWRQAVTNNIHDAKPFIHKGVPGPRLNAYQLILR